jgi:Cft2 family RNA processing exonuclease
LELVCSNKALWKSRVVVELECLPYGVGHADEGVCLLLRMGSHRILLDCGLSNVDSLCLEPGIPPADLVLCTHAHPDHAQGLLALHHRFPQLPIYASEVTAELLPLNWPEDSPVPRFCQALPWRSPIEFREGLTAELIPAGHLPGAATLLLTHLTDSRSYRVFYTGDFLLSNSRLVDGLPLDQLRGLKPDVLIVEGSYGTARFSHRRQQENQLAECIDRAIANRQSVLLVTPSLGLGQEILMLLRSHHYFTGRDLDIWVDGIVAKGCDLYLEMLPQFPSTVQNFARHQSLFWDERVRPRVRRLAQLDSTEVKAALAQSPCIVVTDQTNLSHYCQTADHAASARPWLLLLPQQPGRAGPIEAAVMQTLAASPLLQAQLQSQQLQVEHYLLSDHCDGAGTTQLIHNLRPQHVIFVHGTSTYLSDLSGLEELQNRYHLHIPAAGTSVALPIGETFLQPAAPETRYEGELTELDTAVLVSLPEAVTADPRWQTFANTGLLEARWQGEELVLRGVTQRELLSQNLEASALLNVECCQNCVHCRGQRCWNQTSPMFGFRISLDGYCPAFEGVPDAESFEVP